MKITNVTMHVSFKCDFEKRAEKKTERDSRFCYQNIKPNNVEKKKEIKKKNIQKQRRRK